MAIIVAEGEVVITADASGIPKQVAKDIDGAGPVADKAGKRIGAGIVTGFLSAGAVIGAGAWLKGAIDGSSDLNETMSKSSQIFGDNAGVIDQWSDRASENLGLTKAAAAASAAGFGDMFTQIGFSSDQAAAFSQTTVQMAADLGSFNNLDTADVADRMSAAFRGEYDSLQAVIPNINAARVESEALAATGKTAASELTAQEKATAVLAIVSKDGAKAMGDFARTSDGFANQSKIATATLGDMQAEVGTALLPAMQGFMGFLLETGIPALKTLGDWFTKNLDWIGLTVGILAVLGAAWWIVNIAMTANPVGLIVAGIVLLVAAISWLVFNFDVVVAFFQGVWNDALIRVGGAFAALGAWFVAVGDGIATWWSGLWSGIGNALGAAWAWFTGLITSNFLAVVAFFVGVGATISAWWSGLWAGIGNALGAAWAWYRGLLVGAIVGILSYLSSAGSRISSWWSSLWSGIGSFLGGVWAGIKSTVSSSIEGVVGYFTSMPGKIIGALGNAGSLLASVGRNIVEGLGRGITNGISGLLSIIKGMGTSILNAAKSILGIKSPSTVFEHQVGEMIPAGAGRGVVKGKPALARIIEGMVEMPTGTAGGSIGGPRGGGAGLTINGNVVLDAKNIQEWTDVVDMLKAMPQAARAGRGSVRMAG